jgi:hypothetical protein
MLHHRKTTGQGTFLIRSNPELIARFKERRRMMEAMIGEAVIVAGREGREVCS